MAEARDFKFGIQLGFAKTHHKITTKGKSGHSLGQGELPKNLGFHFNVYTMAEARNFKVGAQLGFAKATIKTHPEEKLAWPWAGKAPKYLGSPSIFLHGRTVLLALAKLFVFTAVHLRGTPSSNFNANKKQDNTRVSLSGS